MISKFPIVWSETGPRTKPNDVKISSGWSITPPEQPPAVWFNWLLWVEQTKINELVDASNLFESTINNAIIAGGLTPVPGDDENLARAIFANNALGDSALANGISFGHFGPLGDIDQAVGENTSQMVPGRLTLVRLNASFRNTITLNSSSSDPLIQVSQQTPLPSGYYEIARVKHGEIEILSTQPSSAFAKLTRTSLVIETPSLNGTFIASPASVNLANTASGESVSVSPTGGFYAADERTDNPGEQSINVRVAPRGTLFGGVGNPGGDSVYHRFAVYTLNTSVFSFFNLLSKTGGDPDHQHTIGFRFYLTSGADFGTSIPSDCPMLGATLRYYKASDPSKFCIVPVILNAAYPSPGADSHWFILNFAVPGLDDASDVSTTENMVLTIHYDAVGL